MLALLAATLSPKRYEQMIDIMHRDDVLTSSGGGGGLQSGSDLYWISILGTPSTAAPWMFQFGGHHLAINASIVGNNSTLAPSLPAAQPVSLSLNGTTVRQMGAAIDKSFALVNALTPTQRTVAVLSGSYIDLVLRPGQDGKTIVPKGIKASALTAAQQMQLLDLAGEWINILNDADGTIKMAEVKANRADTYFAWFGPTTASSASNFRIQGPTLHDSPQQLSGSATKHTHTMYPELGNDYGAKWITQ